MLALDFREQKRLGDAIQDTGGWTAAAALFEPRVPSWTDVRALRDFLATQTRRAAAPTCDAERRWVEPRAPITQVVAEAVMGYTMISCRLYRHMR